MYVCMYVYVVTGDVGSNPAQGEFSFKHVCMNFLSDVGYTLITT